ncbi:hypothetical protein BT69DRAFT_1279389 [Atractiella rhizophila]|nr:hypothetical protein BT69DRAFT_1279389 [Atractiella rhizophila]
MKPISITNVRHDGRQSWMGSELLTANQPRGKQSEWSSCVRFTGGKVGSNDNRPFVLCCKLLAWTVLMGQPQVSVLSVGQNFAIAEENMVVCRWREGRMFAKGSEPLILPAYHVDDGGVVNQEEALAREPNGEIIFAVNDSDAHFLTLSDCFLKLHLALHTK